METLFTISLTDGHHTVEGDLCPVLVVVWYHNTVDDVAFIGFLGQAGDAAFGLYLNYSPGVIHNVSVTDSNFDLTDGGTAGLLNRPLQTDGRENASGTFDVTNNTFSDTNGFAGISHRDFGHVITGSVDFSGVTGNTFTNTEGLTGAIRNGSDYTITAGSNTIDGESYAQVTIGVGNNDFGVLNQNDTLSGASGSDYIRGGQGADVINGAGGADFIDGGEDNDTLTGGGGADNVSGGDGLDTAKFAGNFEDYTITWDGTTATVSGGSDGTDTVTGVGRLEFDNKAVWLVDDSVGAEYTTVAQLFDGNPANGEAAAGDIVMVAAGIYSDSFTIDRGVTILGANAGTTGNGMRGSESIIAGEISITTTSQVVIDGVEVLDDQAYALSAADNFVGIRIMAHSSTAGGHTVTNSVIRRDPATDPMGFSPSVFVGSGLQPTHRGIELVAIALGFAVTIEGNLITNGNTFPYAGDNWRSGIYSNGGAGDTFIQNNTFNNSRSEINADNFTDTVVVSGNTFIGSGSGISIGVGSDSSITSIQNNTFTDVDNDFNFGNLTTAVTFDATASVNSAGTNLDDPLGVLYIVGGSGADGLVGTAGVDVFDNITSDIAADNLSGGAGNDIFIIRTGAQHASGEIISGGADTDVIRFTATLADTLTLRAGVTGVETVQISDANGDTSGTTALNVDASAADAMLATIEGNDGDNVITATAFGTFIFGKRRHRVNDKIHRHEI